MCNNCQNSNNNCGCSQTTVTHNNCQTCPPEPCACPVMLTTNCVTYNGDDLACSGIEKNTNLTETIQQLDEFICETKDQLYNAFSLVNVGTGSQVYKGVDGIGRKELRTLLGSSLIDVTQGTNDIVIAVDEAALSTLIDASQKTYSVLNVGTGAGVYKNSTVVGDNTQFNLRKIKSSDSSITITEGTDDIDLISAVSISVPDATSTIKGILKLTNDLGGTADLPTTPTALHKTTNESFTGIKSSTNSGTGQNSGIKLINDATGGTGAILDIDVNGAHRGILVTNGVSSSLGIQVAQNSTLFGGAGISVVVAPTSNSCGLKITGTGVIENINASSQLGSNIIAASVDGNSIVSVIGIGSTAGSGFTFVGKNFTTTTFTVDKLGNVNGNTFVKTGGTSTQYLMADGTVKENNPQKVITYPADFTGTNYTLTNADNDYVIFIDNGATAVTITLNTSVTTSNFSVGFIQEGSSDVTFIGTGISLTNPVGLKSKGQGYQTFIERKLATSIYYLIGNTKA